MTLNEAILEKLVVCSTSELILPEAQEVALAVEGRKWFRRLECRRLASSITPSSEENEEAISIVICPSMEMAEAEASAFRTDQQESTEQIAIAKAKTDESQFATVEAVIFEVEVEVPQFPVHPIQRFETIAALFLATGEGAVLMVLTLAQREDFPLVPHLYSESWGFKRSLCLWDESPLEIRLSWTAARYLERIREWLRLSARNELHAPDQPLYPLLYSTPNYLVAPESLLSGQNQENQSTFGGKIIQTGTVQTFIVRSQNNSSSGGFVAASLYGESLLHGVVEQAPQTLAELHEFAKRTQIDFFSVIQKQLLDWRLDPTTWKSRIVWIFFVPHQRAAGLPIERIEQHAFATDLTVEQLGAELGLWIIQPPQSNSHQVQLLLTINPDNTVWNRKAPLVSLCALNVAPLLSRETAALFNGLEKAENPKILALGAGALGSQTFFNLARAGWGDWYVVDRDLYLPHNGARHALSGAFIGYPKATAVCQIANSLFDESFDAKPLVGEVLTPDEKLQDLLSEADIILDFSASVPVARALSHEIAITGRCVSIFLNPSGSQLVVLTEDTARSITLADIEMQFWRSVIENPDWCDYFENQPGKIRYARSCGDRSSRLPQDLVATHAANASRAVRRLITFPNAALMRWRFDALTETQCRLEKIVESVRVWTCGDWTVRASIGVLEQLQEYRQMQLPSETGGILLGVFDRGRKIAYLVAVLPAPPDSDEQPSSFLRGHEGLREAVKHVQHQTQGQVDYLGEWHSHPQGRDTQPSLRDFALFTYLAKERIQDGLPALMLIVSDGDDITPFVESMPEPIAPKLS